MKRLGIIGSGDLGQLMAHHASSSGDYEVMGFFDDFASKGKLVSGIKVKGTIDDVLALFDAGMFDELAIGIGYKHMDVRKKVYERFHERIKMAKVIHPSSYVDPSCKIGNGVFILPGCTLDMNVKVLDNVFINTASTIAHDSLIGAHTFLSPSTAIAGFVKIGECCVIGINTTVIDNITIADGVQTGGGTVVIKDIDIKGLHVGNPAKFIR
jgi:sugar O-acyltransferase (sialic acid O-acetyltransferase NeuD family)